MKQVRRVVYVKDVQNITGRSESYARKILRAIRKKLNKEKHELVSVDQLCQYLGIEETVVLDHLRQ